MLFTINTDTKNKCTIEYNIISAMNSTQNWNHIFQFGQKMMVNNLIDLMLQIKWNVLKIKISSSNRANRIIFVDNFSLETDC